MNNKKLNMSVGGLDKVDWLVDGNEVSSLTLNNPHPNAIVFTAPDYKEVMRITAEGVVIANGVTVDEASVAVIAALSGYIRNLVAGKDDEIARLKAKLQEKPSEL